MNSFSKILIVAYFFAFLGLVGEIYFKFSGERDVAWRYEWIFESMWFSLFTLFLFAILIIMRPNEHSKTLAMMQQIGDSQNDSVTNRD